MEPAPHDAERMLAESGWVRRLARSLTRDGIEADDLIQDALVVSLTHGSEARGPLGAWFAGVLRQLAWKRRRESFRRRQREQAAARAEALPGSDEIAARLALQQELARAVYALPEPYRSALVLRFLDELPVRAIARRTATNVHTVRSRLQRAKELLRRELEARPGGRAGWLPALAALGKMPGGQLSGVLWMGTHGKLVAALVLAGLATWIGVHDWRGTETPASMATLPSESGVRIAQAPSGPPQAPAIVEPARREVATAQVAATAPGARLALHVVELESGAALEGVEVEWTPEAGTGALRTTTDADGRASIPSVSGIAAELTLHAPMWRAREERRKLEALAPGELRALEVALATRPDARIFGRVVDAQSGAGLGGAGVRLDDFDSWRKAQGADGAPGLAETTSADDGSFLLDVRSWAPSVLRVSRSGFGTCMQSSSLARGDAHDPWIVRLEREAVVELALVRSDASPRTALLARASVGSFELLDQAGPWNFRWQPDPSFEAAVDARGLARIRGLPARVPFEVRVQDGERTLFQTTTSRLAPGETLRIEFTLQRDVAVEGVVADELGRAMAGVELWAVQGRDGEERYFGPAEVPLAKARSDEGGHYVISGLSSGDWRIGPAPAGFLGARGGTQHCAGLARPVTLEGEFASTRVDFTVWRRLAIRGVARKCDGSPMVAASLFAVCMQGRGTVFGMTDARGEFALGPLVPGSYAVMGSAHVGSAAPTAIAEAGALGLELVFPCGGSVRGRLLRPEGAAAESYWLAFQPKAPGMLPSSWSSSAPHAEAFLREDLDPGRYTLIARTQDGWIGVLDDVTVEAGKETAAIEIPLERQAQLELLLDGESASATVELWRGEGFLGRYTLERGAKWSEFFPAGAIQLRHVTAAGETSGETQATLLRGERFSLALSY